MLTSTSLLPMLKTPLPVGPKLLAIVLAVTVVLPKFAMPPLIVAVFWESVLGLSVAFPATKNPPPNVPAVSSESVLPPSSGRCYCFRICRRSLRRYLLKTWLVVTVTVDQGVEAASVG